MEVVSKAGCKNIKIVLLYRVIRATYDVNLHWNPFEIRRNHAKSIFTYKILDDQTAPNLKSLFQLSNDMNHSNAQSSK